MKRKHIIRELKKQAEAIPPETYFALEKYASPRWDEDENGRFERNGVKGEYKVGTITELPVNHKRRVKRIFNKWGINAVRAYFYVKLHKNKYEKEESSSDSLPQEGSGTIPSGVAESV